MAKKLLCGFLRGEIALNIMPTMFLLRRIDEGIAKTRGQQTFKMTVRERAKEENHVVITIKTPAVAASMHIYNLIFERKRTRNSGAKKFTERQDERQRK